MLARFVPLVIVSSVASAEPHRVALEIDPFPYVFFHGFDAVVGYQHPASPVRISLSGYVTDTPPIGIPDGFHGRQRGTVLKIAHHFGAGGRGWMVGGFSSFTSTRYTHDDFAGMSDSLSSLIVGGIVGYRWFPFRRRLFLYPWGRVGIALPVRGNRDIAIGDQSYKASLLDAVATFHIGYEFSL